MYNYALAISAAINMYDQRDKAGLGYRSLQSRLHYTSYFFNQTFNMHEAFTNFAGRTLYNICIFCSNITGHTDLVNQTKLSVLHLFFLRLAVLLIKELLTPGENMFIL